MNITAFIFELYKKIVRELSRIRYIKELDR